MYDFTYTWNLKSKTNAQSKQRVTDTGNKPMVASGERGGGGNKIGEEA